MTMARRAVGPWTEPPQGQLALEPVPDWLVAGTIDEAWWRFHRSHPDVYDELVRLAREALHAGRDRIGIGMLFEVLRWNRMLRRDDAEAFKLNNSYRSRYSRLIMAREADLDGMFETRELRSP